MALKEDDMNDIKRHDFSTTKPVFLCLDEAAMKRKQTLQIDAGFIIHGSKNITSPPRKKSFKDALDWAKKITKAFGEVGVNKTRIGVILYAEKPELMFNMSTNLDRDAVMKALDKLSSPPALGDKTMTGKALELALSTLVNETRKEAIKKFFVFSDRPPDDDATSLADVIKKKDVELYGLSSGSTSKIWKNLSLFVSETKLCMLTASEGYWNEGPVEREWMRAKPSR